MKTAFYDIVFKIDELIKEYSQENLETIESFFEHEGIFEYFFRELAKSTDPFPWLEPLKEKEYFNPRNNPSPFELPDKKGNFTIPQWNVLGYLENVAIQNSEKSSNTITELLLDIVNSISNYRNEAGKRIDNFRTDWAIVKIIFTLPLEKINDDHIEFVGISLKSKLGADLVAGEIEKNILPKLINNEAKDLILKLMNAVFDYQENDKEIPDKYSSVMDEFWLNKALKTHKPAIAKLYGIEAAEIALNKIITITNEDKSQFDNIWIPTIEDHPQTHFSDRYECQLVYFVRDMFELSEATRIETKINNLLREEHPIFKRIALHTINYHYKDLNQLFWNWINNPLDENMLKHELYKLLKVNCSSFSKEQIRKVIVWIEYKEYQDINPAELDHPGFSYWVESWTGTTSPIEKVELLNKSNEDTVEYLINYK